jgi:hypothetical protein
MVIRHAGILVALVFGACAPDDPQKAVFEKLARDARPHLEAIQPFARDVVRMEGTGPDVEAAIVMACRKPSASLQALKEIDFRAGGANPPFGYSVGERAGDLLDSQKLYCEKLRDPRECVQFCVREWTELALAIEHFRGDAAVHGVYVPDLFHQL